MVPGKWGNELYNGISQRQSGKMTDTTGAYQQHRFTYTIFARYTWFQIWVCTHLCMLLYLTNLASQERHITEALDTSIDQSMNGFSNNKTEDKLRNFTTNCRL